ncbi:MAG: isoprenylcysteine carboxylmethyltransferase family protein [Bryobacterales bacterium]|nr:isoprenylcysteine carboxylmethyltransferase family protein [Bryobacterales bacterium]
MKRTLIFGYGVLGYAVFLVSLLYAVGFLANFIVPRSIDSTPTIGTGWALLADIGLLSAFALQHSIMARPAFKRAWTRIIPEPAERSTYVLLSSILLGTLCYFWQPIGGVIWNIEGATARGIVYGMFASGCLLVLAATFQINHFDLFGLRQAWFVLMDEPYKPIPFRKPFLYRQVRHPLYVGWLMAFWSAPTMTVAHMLFAVMTTCYILIAIQFEERDLVQQHGRNYLRYRQEVPMLVPFTGKTGTAPVQEPIEESA